MKTLIVYGSKYGATKICAKKIAKGLKGKVEVINLKDKKVIALKDYDKVLIGTSIYAGMVRKEVKRFCHNNKEELMTKKLGLFLSCMEENIETYINNGFSEDLKNNFLVTVGCGGIFNFSKMNFFEKFIIKKIYSSKKDAKGNTTKIDTKTNIEKISNSKIQEFVEAVNLV